MLRYRFLIGFVKYSMRLCRHSGARGSISRCFETLNIDLVGENFEIIMVSILSGRCTLIVAHRLSTVKSADKIVVIENGVIVEQGTHDELLHREDGIYKGLLKTQEENQGGETSIYL